MSMTTTPPAPPTPPTPPTPPPAAPPPAPPSSGGVALQVGAVITGLLIILGALNLFQLTVGRESTRSHYAFGSSSSTLRLTSDNADVTVVAGDGGQITVERKASTAHGRSVSRPSLAGDTLTLPGDCHGGAVGWLLFCSVSYVVHVPADLDLTVRTGSGDIEVAGVHASRLVVRAGSGDLDLSDVTAPSTTASTGSGDIDVTALLSPQASIETGSGDADLAFAQAPTDVKASTGSGDLTVRVPRDDAIYTVHEHNGSGDFTNHLLSGDQTPATAVARVLDVSTGSGDLTLAYLD